MTRVPSSNSRKADTFLHFSNGAEEGAEEGELSEYREGGLVPMSSLIEENRGGGQHYSVVAVIMTALRKSLVTCSLGAEEVCSSSMEIGRPTGVRHVSHVTFDRFHGFLGLPVEFQPQVPRRAPSASVRVFGVSPDSMQCSYDNRGNSGQQFFFYCKGICTPRVACRQRAFSESMEKIAKRNMLESSSIEE